MLRDAELAAFEAAVFRAGDRGLEPGPFCREIIVDEGDRAALEVGIEPQFPLQGGIDGIRRGEIPFDTLPDIDGRHFDDTQDALDLLVGQVQDVAVVVVGHAGHPRFGLDEDHGRNHGHHEEPKQEDPPRQPSGEGLDGHSHAGRAPIP